MSNANITEITLFKMSNAIKQTTVGFTVNYKSKHKNIFTKQIYFIFKIFCFFLLFWSVLIILSSFMRNHLGCTSLPVKPRLKFFRGISHLHNVFDLISCVGVSRLCLYTLNEMTDYYRANYLFTNKHDELKA